MFHAKIFSKKAGIILTEALVAVATMATGVVVLGSISTNALSTTILNRDYLVAGGLLDEADQVVKTIRYSNLLLKPADKTCWLRIVPDNSMNCTKSVAKDSNYIIVLENWRWQMQEAGTTDLDLTKTQDSNNQFQIYLDNNPESFGYRSSLSALSDSNISKSIFFRSIKFTDVAADNSQAAYTVTMQWKNGSKVSKIVKTGNLFNY